MPFISSRYPLSSTDRACDIKHSNFSIFIGIPGLLHPCRFASVSDVFHSRRLIYVARESLTRGEDTSGGLFNLNLQEPHSHSACSCALRLSPLLQSPGYVHRHMWRLSP